MTSSKELYRRASQLMPGGVNSPVRAFNGVGGEPLFIARAQGAYLYDVADRCYIDYVGSWGPMVAGHAHPKVLDAVSAAAQRGLSFGAPSPLEVQMAERIHELVPSVEMLRMVNSGTEATMSALRLARGATGRDTMIKFAGCYHGHGDAFLVKAGSGALTLGVPNSPGVPSSYANLTVTLPYNDAAAVRQAMRDIGGKVACIIVEPVAGNMNCIPPLPGFLECLRTVCDEHGSILIFDEVMTGFRVALGGAQAHYDVKPDLSTFGKIIGGGMPVGAFGGKRELMQQIAPTGPIYQAGTLSGNPVAMAAGLASLDLLCEADFYDRLSDKTRQLCEGLERVAKAADIPLTTNQVGGMFGFFFTEEREVRSYDQVLACDIDRFKAFFHAMLKRGVYLAPSAFEAGFMSSAHSDADIAETIKAAADSFAELV